MTLACAGAASCESRIPNPESRIPNPESRIPTVPTARSTCSCVRPGAFPGSGCSGRRPGSPCRA
ncbi:hypothetical protein DYQ91_05190 [Xanthomonas sp. LMG 8989]|nr:hypothetical protein [Xanthomonas sp. LMG 8989]